MAAARLTFRPLDLSDLNEVDELEIAAFKDPSYRCTRDKFEYRLTRKPCLSLGLFSSSTDPDHVVFKSLTAASAVHTPDSHGDKKMSLVAHACSTLGLGPFVTDADMAYPKDWREPGVCESESIGHQPDGRTVCLHSFAVDPKVQRRGAGKLAMSAFLDAMRDMECVDRVALLCQEYLVGYYSKLGFKNEGPSTATYEGGGWFNMVMDVKSSDD